MPSKQFQQKICLSQVFITGSWTVALADSLAPAAALPPPLLDVLTAPDPEPFTFIVLDFEIEDGLRAARLAIETEESV